MKNEIRELTREAHVSAEENPLNKAFINGTINDSAYNVYLYQRYLVIKELDFYLPYQFSRAKFFEMDLPENYEDSLPILYSTREYLNYLEDLPEEKMISQIYVNYMGDLHGGQIIRNNNPSKPNHHLDVLDIRNDFIHHVRDRISDRAQELAPYASEAFNFLESILDETIDYLDGVFEVEE